MKGIILAGGSGTRLRPLTVATNKHLLSLYDKPVIFYAVATLVDAGVDQIMIVTNPHHVEDFVKLLGSGKDFISKKTGNQIQIAYTIQNEPHGIAHALYLASDYIGNDHCVLYLGDNIFEDDIASHIKNFKKGARVFLKEVSDPERFGVAHVGPKGKVLSIEEKPTKPKSNFAVTGLYLYDHTVLAKLQRQNATRARSKRGEYEITHINNAYIKEGTLHSVILKKEWFDIGTFDSLLDASMHMRHKKNGKPDTRKLL
jgi:glucose-1-phosphate thymidylyltransferase